MHTVKLLTTIGLGFVAGGWVHAERAPTSESGRVVQTPYTQQKVVFDFFLDDPRKMGVALYWIRSLLNPLMESPYNYQPESLDLVVVAHGTEIVTLVQQNYGRFQEQVDRMRYYAELGVRFKVCGLAAEDYGYQTKDFYDFVDIVPSAIPELAHWQLQGYALIAPQVQDKKFAIEEIR
ncbi:MAG: DsrE family protein [Thiotrichales bacterium]